MVFDDPLQAQVFHSLCEIGKVRSWPEIDHLLRIVPGRGPHVLGEQNVVGS